MEIVFDFSFLSIVDILSISTAFMLGILFTFSKTKNRKANIFLGLFLWSLSLEVLGSFLESAQGISFAIPNTTLFTIPFLLFYVRKTLDLKINFYYLFLFIPGIVINFYPIEHFIEYLFNIPILIFVLMMLKTHRSLLGEYFSALENKTLAWIKTIVFIFLFFHFFWIAEDIVGFQNEDVGGYFAMTSTLLTFFMIYWIGYNGFSQSEIFSSLQFQIKLTEETAVTIEEYEEHNKQFSEMSNIIIERELFKDPNLDLRTLSDQLDMKEKEVSRLIKLNTQKNFYHYINQFRVEDFKKLLNSSKASQLTLLGLAMEAGFSSKSTFYSVFKNTEGITPKQYQDRLKSPNEG